MTRSFTRQDFFFVLLVCIVLLACCVRIRLLSVPLERDEGEYAYSGQLLLQGVPPFAEAYNMKMPGIYVAYAAILGLFGQTASGIHFGLLCVNALSCLLLYRIARRLYDPAVGCMAAAAFAAASLGESVLGFFAHAEHFVVLFALAGLLALLNAFDKKKTCLFFAAGLLCGCAVLMKQHGAALALFALAFLAYRRRLDRPRQWKPLAAEAALFGAGCVLPFGLVCAWMFLAGTWDRFWFWTFTYAKTYVSHVPLRAGLVLMHQTLSSICRANPLVWTGACAGLVSLLLDAGNQTRRFFVVCFVILSFAACCPGLIFRQHYFILLLPSAALLCAAGFDFAIGFAVKRVRYSFVRPLLVCLVAAAIAGYPLLTSRALFFHLTPRQISRAIYGPNPFVESCVIADSLKAWTTVADRIAVMGSEPQIYFYAHRRSATGYIYTYALMENQPYALRMQQDMIRQIESQAPRYIVYVNVTTSWLKRPGSPVAIFEWFNKFQKSHYEIAGVADLVSPSNTVYAWGSESKKYEIQSPFWLAVFKRKDDAAKTGDAPPSRPAGAGAGPLANDL